LAKGDAVVSIANIAAAGTGTYQPAAGVETVIFAAGGDNAQIEITNGALTADYIHNGNWFSGGGLGAITAASNTLVGSSAGTKVFVTNSVYIQIRNPTGGTHPYFFSGVQTK
tara:strand:- start:597 stop:932 length:336 start_codon:yes stop_codon:yes gene_type:complete